MSERVCEREIEQKKRRGYERRRERERDERRGEERREEERGRERGEERRERETERGRERERYDQELWDKAHNSVLRASLVPRTHDSFLAHTGSLAQPHDLHQQAVRELLDGLGGAASASSDAPPLVALAAASTATAAASPSPFLAQSSTCAWSGAASAAAAAAVLPAAPAEPPVSAQVPSGDGAETAASSYCVFDDPEAGWPAEEPKHAFEDIAAAWSVEPGHADAPTHEEQARGDLEKVLQENAKLRPARSELVSGSG